MHTLIVYIFACDSHVIFYLLKLLCTSMGVCIEWRVLVLLLLTPGSLCHLPYYCDPGLPLTHNCTLWVTSYTKQSPDSPNHSYLALDNYLFNVLFLKLFTIHTLCLYLSLIFALLQFICYIDALPSHSFILFTIITLLFFLVTLMYT